MAKDQKDSFSIIILKILKLIIKFNSELLKHTLGK